MTSADTTFRRPFRLRNKVQHYDWGTKDGNAFIPHLTGSPVMPGLPYAELWIGAHPSAPSEIVVGNRAVRLDRVIGEVPLEILGEEVARAFRGKLPFLLKVLSAARALSIQTHPNKEQARKLHAADPAHYPDDNHKPEIAIALDSLTAIAGFRPAREIADAFRRHPELGEITGEGLMRDVLSTRDETRLAGHLKAAYAEIMRRADDEATLDSVIGNVVDRLSAAGSRSEEEKLFADQYGLYGADVGLLSIFFFNLIHLKERQAIFTEAGVPHAYIRGNIVECMANSDNVVRAGLTGKFKDVASLLEIMTYRFGRYPVINEDQRSDGVVYRTGAAEFELTGYRKGARVETAVRPGRRPVVVLVLSGSLDVRWEGEGAPSTEAFRKGESFLIPAVLPEVLMSAREDVEFYTVSVP